MGIDVARVGVELGRDQRGSLLSCSSSRRRFGGSYKHGPGENKGRRMETAGGCGGIKTAWFNS